MNTNTGALQRRSVQASITIAVVAVLLVSFALVDTVYGPQASNAATQPSPSVTLVSGATSPGGGTPPTTGVIVPMFTNDSLKEVPQLVAEAQAYPNVPITVIANPDDGPGPAQNTSYGAGLSELEHAGITVLGYVPTDWAQTAVSSVEQQAQEWRNWYNTSGIYLDQMYNEEYNYEGAYVPTYYSTLSSYIRTLGMDYVFGNAGADIPYYMVGTVTAVGYFENSYLPSVSTLGGWHTNYTKSDFAFFTYGQNSIDPDYIAVASDYVGSLYITNGVHPFPYGSLPPYFDQLVSTLSSLVPVTIQTELPNGSMATRGFEVTVRQPNGITTTAYAPSTFDVVAGSIVTVTAKNFGGYVFADWNGGNTQTTITIQPTQPTTLIAYSKTSQTTAALVTVRTNESNGIPVQGIWTAIYAPDGKLVASGYTPFTFDATRGENYTLVMQNYKSYDFLSWANGATSQRLSITPTGNLLIYAFVRNSTGNQSTSSTA